MKTNIIKKIILLVLVAVAILPFISSALLTPTVTFTATPASVNSGSMSTLTWHGTNILSGGSSCTITGPGFNTPTNHFSANGSMSTIALTEPTTFSIDCFGNAETGFAHATASVSVGINGTGNAPTLTLTASPTTITLPNTTTSTITWSGANLTSCEATSGTNQWFSFWFSDLPSLEGGTHITSPTVTTTYALSCIGTNGSSINRSVTVTVVNTNNPPTVLLIASPTNINAGQISTLTWSGENLVLCSALNGTPQWDASNPSPSGGTFQTAPVISTTYGISCKGTNGEFVTSNATILVAGTNLEASSVTLTPIPSQIVGGQSAILSWTSNNLSSTGTPCTASGGWSGSKASTGTQSISPTTTTVYTITCNTLSGGTVTSTTAPDVLPGPDFDIIPANSTVTLGQNRVLTWSGDWVPAGNNVCTASGGRPGDGWAGPKAFPAFGATVSFNTGAFTQQGTYIYTLNCPSVYNNAVTVSVNATILVTNSIPNTQICNTPNTLGVCTNDATSVGDTSAYLNGKAMTVSGKDAYAYFRYTTIKLPTDKPPLFCNDMYGSQMRSTEEEHVNHTWSSPAFSGTFDTPIQGLSPDTQYAYCAVVSNHPTNPTQIRYGEIRTFRTLPCTDGDDCPQAGVETREATHVSDTSAQLNGIYRNVPAADTYFMYKKSLGLEELFFDPITGQIINNNPWIRVGGEGTGEHEGEILDHRDAKTYGNMNYFLENLEPNTNYKYKAYLKTHESTTPASPFSPNGQIIPSQNFEGEMIYFTTTLPIDFDPDDENNDDEEGGWTYVPDITTYVYPDYDSGIPGTPTYCPQLTINPISGQVVNAENTLSFTATVCGDLPLSWPSFYSFDLPEGATIDGSTGIFTWTPTEAQVGEYDVTINANDSFGNSANPVIVHISVLTPVNGGNGGNFDPCPQLTINPISGQVVNAENTLSFAVTTCGAGPLNWVTYWATGLPQGAILNNATGVFTWTPTEAQVGEYDVTINANEWFNIATPVDVHISVQAPLVGGTGSTGSGGSGGFTCNPFQIVPLANQSVQEDSTIAFAVNTCGEPTGVNITYSMSGLPTSSGATLGTVLGSTGGIFTWTPVSTHIGVHNVTFNASFVGNPDPLGNSNIVNATPEIIQITVTKKTSGGGEYENLSGVGPWDGQGGSIDGCITLSSTQNTCSGGTSSGNGPWMVTGPNGLMSGNGPWTGDNTSYSNGIGDGNTISGNGRWTVRIPRRNGTNNSILVLGQTATPPNDAIVRYHEGIEHALQRQIVKNKVLATRYGYTAGQDIKQFAWNTADFFARIFGYVDGNGKEIRVVEPDIAAYEIQLRGNKLIIYEYYDNKIVNIQQLTDALRSSYDFEYYFQKR